MSGLLIVSSASTFRDSIFIRNDIRFLVGGSNDASVTFKGCVFDNEASDLTLTGQGVLLLISCENRLPQYISFDQVSCPTVDRLSVSISEGGRVDPKGDEAKSDGVSSASGSATGIGISTAVAIVVVALVAVVVVWCLRRPSRAGRELLSDAELEEADQAE
jgi:hypothetical protein